MALSDDLNIYVKSTFKDQWSKRSGQIVPEPKDLKATNDTIEFERATILYADLSGSTSMVDGQSWQFAAEIYKNFLYCSARLINSMNGVITAYDGDRIMGVFVGASQSTNATKCAFKINYSVIHIIRPALQNQYSNNSFKLDTSPIRVAKTGVRGENDLVWVGRAASYAAKLTELDSDFPTWITSSVHTQLHESMKYGGSPPQNMWEKRTWTAMGNMEIYRSNWHWKVDVA
jgi:class 3 adenylate cyclase